METSMKRFALITLLCCVFLTRTHALALDTIRIAYSSVNPHALLVSMAEKRAFRIHLTWPEDGSAPGNLDSPEMTRATEGLEDKIRELSPAQRVPARI
jgi:hypothetical protein